MARIQARLRCNYFPLPDAEALRIRTALRFPDDPCSVIDPCVGEGRALAAITTGAKCLRYGIELDAYRAEEARGVCDQVIQGDCLSTQAKAESVSLLYCNPPYDTEQGPAGNRRLENLFLSHTARWLVPRGVLVFVISCAQLKDCATSLAHEFAQIRVFRLTSPSSVQYQQVVVFGSARGRKERERTRDTEIDRTRSWLTGLAWSYEALPALDDSAPTYAVPRTGPAEIVYQGIPLDTVEDLLPQSAAYRQASHLLDPERVGPLARPLSPLHSGHVGLLACVGAVDRVLGSGERLHVAAWKSKKITHRTEEVEGDTTIVREREQFVHELALVFADGSTALLE